MSVTMAVECRTFGVVFNKEPQLNDFHNAELQLSDLDTD